MIPILLDDSKALATLVSEQTNGLGALSDCTECTVTEERNGQYTLEMTYPITGIHFSEIKVGGLLKAKAGDTTGLQIFRIEKISKPLNGIVTIYANHISYDLKKTSVAAFTATGAADTFAKLKANMTGGSAFTFWTDDDNSTSSFTNSKPQAARALLGGQDGSVLDVFGGEYEWDNLTVKHHLHRGSDNGVIIEYGKNLTDIRQDETIESMYTAVMPYWTSSDATVAGDLQTVLEVADDDVKVLNLDVTQMLTVDTGETPTTDQINAAAQTYIKAHDLAVPKVSIEVSFVNLWQTEEYKEIAPLERVSLCDTVTVRFPKLGVEATAKVVKTVYDVMKEKYDSIEIGSARSTLASTITDIADTAASDTQKATSMLEEAIATATKLIQGGLGGHVVFNTNADGEPDEILIMDTDDISTAVNVIRMNLNGIGFSTTGYNGPFTTAWTIDGGFVADFIKSGAINAIDIIGSLIRGATLIFGSYPDGEYVTMKSNDDDTGGIIQGEGTIEFETQGKFDAKNVNSESSFPASIIRMMNDSSDTNDRNYINLMNYNLLKTDTSYYGDIANAIYITANSDTSRGNTMRFQNYVQKTAANDTLYTANQLLLEYNASMADTTVSNYEMQSTNVANRLLLKSKDGPSNYADLVNWYSGTITNRIELHAETGGTSHVLLQNYTESGAGANNIQLYTDSGTIKRVRILNRNYDSIGWANTIYFNSGSTNVNDFICENYYHSSTETVHIANKLLFESLDDASLAQILNYSNSEDSPTNWIEMKTDLSSGEGHLIIQNRNVGSNAYSEIRMGESGNMDIMSRFGVNVTSNDSDITINVGSGHGIYLVGGAVYFNGSRKW